MFVPYLNVQYTPHAWSSCDLGLFWYLGVNSYYLWGPTYVAHRCYQSIDVRCLSFRLMTEVWPVQYFILAYFYYLDPSFEPNLFTTFSKYLKRLIGRTSSALDLVHSSYWRGLPLLVEMTLYSWHPWSSSCGLGFGVFACLHQYGTKVLKHRILFHTLGMIKNFWIIEKWF